MEKTREIAGWLGVDFDGVLVEGPTTAAEVFTTGKPILAMIERVKFWVAAGIDVRILTARVGCCGERSPAALDDRVFADGQREMIQAWCAEHIGVALPVTATKDFLMIALIDDRVIPVETNTGRIPYWPSWLPAVTEVLKTESPT